MTALERILSKPALAALDQLRRARGIHSRRAALESVLLEAAESLEAQLTPAELRLLQQRLSEVARGEVVAAEVVFADLETR